MPDSSGMHYILCGPTAISHWLYLNKALVNSGPSLNNFTCVFKRRAAQNSCISLFATYKPPYYSDLPHHFPELSQLSQAMALTNSAPMARLLRSLQLSLRTKLLLPLVF